MPPPTETPLRASEDLGAINPHDPFGNCSRMDRGIKVGLPGGHTTFSTVWGTYRSKPAEPSVAFVGNTAPLPSLARICEVSCCLDFMHGSIGNLFRAAMAMLSISRSTAGSIPAKYLLWASCRRRAQKWSDPSGTSVPSL